MAGTTHYNYIFKGETGELWKVEILDSTYAGVDSITLWPDGNGFGLTWEGAGEEVYQPIIASEFITNVFRDANSRALLDAIIEGPESRFTVRVYLWITSSYVLYWQGFILQDSMTKPDAADNTAYIMLTATDGFGLLKDIKYTGFDIDALTRLQVNEWVTLVMAYLPEFTASVPMCGFASVWYEDSEQTSVVPSPSAADPLANTYVNQSAFLQVDDYGVVQPLSFYDILNSILLVHNLQISQCNGRFLIIQQNTYTQAQTRVWWYDKTGAYVSTELIDLSKTIDSRFTGGTFNYILPLKEIRTEYEYRQGIYKNNLLPHNVDPNVIYDLGFSTLSAGISLTGIIEHYYEGSGGTPIEIQAVYKVQVRNGAYYLNLNSANNLEWAASALSYVPIYSSSLISVCIAEMLVVTKIDLILPPLPEEGGVISFTWSFWRYEVFGTKTLWTDVFNTHTETVDDREGSFIARINTGIIQEGTQLFRATIANGARTDIDLENSILGDGANKYSGGALFVNDTIPKIVESDKWTIYSEIGGTGYAINSMRVREILALRRNTLQIYNGTFYGIPDFHKAMDWAGLHWIWQSISFDANNNKYTGSAMAVIVNRSGITVDAPLTKQDTNSTSSNTTGSSTNTETHGRLHNLFSETDHSGTGGTAKTTPIDADSVVIIDSADSSKVKRTTWANVKATIGAYWSRNAGSALLTPVNPGDDISTYGFVKSQSSDGTKSSWFKEGTIYQLSDDAMASGSTRTLTSYLASGVTIWSNNVWATISGVSNHLFYNSVATGEVWTATSRAVTWVIQTVKSGGAILEDRIKILASGSFQIGNDTNNATFDIDGKLRLNGSATVWDDLQTSGLSSKKGGSNDPVFTNIAGNIWIDVFSGTATNEVFFTVQFPHRYKEGSDIEPHVHWFPITSPATTKNVVWKLEYQWQNHDGTFGPTNTTITGTGATGTVGYKGIITSLGVVSGTGKEISSVMICRLYRPGGDALDTYADGAAFLSCDMHYEIDALGSDTEYAK